MNKNFNADGVYRKLENMSNIAKDIMPKALEEFISNTPVDSGHARKNTKLQNTNTILADYEYASILDAGRKSKSGSSQAPKGMVQPTIDYIMKSIDDHIRKS